MRKGNNSSVMRFRRKAAAAMIVAVSGTVLMGFAALAVDVGLLYNVRTELQRSSDAGALAGAWELLGNERLQGSSGLNTVMGAARTRASAIAGLNKVFGTSPGVDLNTSNATDGDIVLGRLNNPENQSENLSSDTPSRINAVSIQVRRDSVRNGPVPLVFAPVLGFGSCSVSARATAWFDSTLTGYKVTAASGNADLLPLALQVDVWNRLLQGVQTTGDNFRYDPQTHAVSAGSDGVFELNLYPGAGSGQLPPGNFGTVDIGNPNNSTADISRQIRYGVNASDLAYFGGELRIPPGGVLSLEGDTGLSAAIKDDLTAIIGQPRAIPLFTTVTGNGNNAHFAVVRFAGIRIMEVRLTGAMNQKRVIIQPAVVVDDAAVSDPGATPSSYVYTPPHLVR